jgi:small subunit ribosomal protein S19
MADDRRRRRRRRDTDVEAGRTEEFSYRGYELEELQEMSLDELAEVLPARARRKIRRGFTEEQRKFVEKVREGEGPFRTHLREQVVLPSFVGKQINVHNGKEFERVDVEPDMIGHLLGEFAQTREDVEHTGPGVGATRSSKYMPLK